MNRYEGQYGSDYLGALKQRFKSIYLSRSEGLVREEAELSSVGSDVEDMSNLKIREMSMLDRGCYS